VFITLFWCDKLWTLTRVEGSLRPLSRRVGGAAWVDWMGMYFECARGHKRRPSESHHGTRKYRTRLPKGARHVTVTTSPIFLSWRLYHNPSCETLQQRLV